MTIRHRLLLTFLVVWLAQPAMAEAAISVSGTAYQNNETTALITTAYNVALRVNGGTASTTTTSTVDGTFSFASITAVAGDTLTLYFYGASDAAAGTYTGNVVTITDGSTNITGVSLIDDHVVLRSDRGTTVITIPDLWDYDNTQNTANLLFDAVDATPDTLSVESGNELFITATDGFTPGGNATVSGSFSTTSGIDIRGTWTATGTETITCHSGWNNAGTFTAAQSTVDFPRDTQGTNYIITGATTFYNLTFSGNGYGWKISDDLVVQNTLSLTNSWEGGNIVADDGEAHTISVAGNVSSTGEVSMGSQLTVVMNGTGAQTVTTSSTTSTTSGSIGSLRISNTITAVQLGSNLKVRGKLTIDINTTLDVTTNNYNIDVWFGYGDSVATTGWVRNGTFTQRQGTVTFTTTFQGLYALITGATTFYNLTFAGSGYGWTISDDLVVQNNLSITSTLDSTNITVDTGETHTISVAGNVSHTGANSMESQLTIVMNGTGAQTVTTSGTGSIGSLKISNTAAAVQLGSNLSMRGKLTIDASATLDVTTNNYNITLWFWLGDSASTTGWVRNGTFTQRQGTVTFTTSFQGLFTLITGATTFYNLTFAGSGYGWDISDDLVVQNNLSITNTDEGEDIRADGVETHTISVGGNVSHTGTKSVEADLTIVMNGTGTQTISTSGAAGGIGSLRISNTSGNDVQLTSSSLNLSGNITVDANGIFDLQGNNIPGTHTVTNNGTLQLTGDQALATITMTLNAGSTVEYTATTGSRAIKDWTYQSLKINGTGGTFTMGAGEVLGENLTVTAGTLDAGTLTLAINGNTTINGGTFKTGTNTITFGNAAGDAVTISSGELQIQSDSTTADIVKTAGTWTNSGGTITYNCATAQSTSLLSALSPYNHLTVNSTGSTYTLNGAITANGNLTITAGTLDTGNGLNYGIQVKGDWDKNGTFTARAGTVTFNGTGTQTINDANTWYGLSITTSTARTVKFQSSVAQTIAANGSLTLGASGELLTLAPLTAATAWNLTVNTGVTQSVSNVSVSYSNAGGGATVTATNSINGGNNTNWSFPALPTGNQGLAGYWSFEEMGGTQAGDFSGNGKTGTLAGAGGLPAWTAGKLGGGLYFDGVDDKISLGNNALGNLGDNATVSAWVKLTGASSYQIISEYESGVCGDYYLGISGGTLNNTDGGSSSVTGTKTVNDGAWHHVVAVSETAGTTLYVDGALDISSATDVNWNNYCTAQDVQIGNRAGTNQPFSGTLDEVRVYSRSLTADQVRELYLAGAAKFNASPTDFLTNGLVGYWTFDGQDTSSTTVTDRSGNGRNGTLNGSPAPIQGRLGQALNFDALATYISTGVAASNFISATDGTLAAWVYPTSTTVPTATYCGLEDPRGIVGDGGGGGYFGITRAVVSGSDRIWVANYDGSADCVGVAYNLDEWIHVVWVHTGGTLYAYKNGELVGSTASGNTSSLTSGLEIGRGHKHPPDATSIFAGRIDEVRVYNRALSAEEVRALYQAGAAKINSSPTDFLTNGLVGYWTFDGADMDWAASTSEAKDRSANGNHGDVQNNTTATVGRIGQALAIDGVQESKVITAAEIGGLDAKTFVGWFKWNSLGSGWQLMVAEIDTFDSNRMSGLTTTENAAKYISIQQAYAGGTAAFNAVTDFAPALNTWYHVAGVVDKPNNTLKLYINGVLYSSYTNGAVGSSTFYNPTGGVAIGGKASTSYSFNGTIDDVRIYTRALSAEEIRALYQAGASSR